MATFFTSDTHFSHKKILCYQFQTRQQFLTPADYLQALELIETNQTRSFKPSQKSVDAMDDFLIDQINQKVGKNDTLWHLGDFFLGDSDKLKKLFDRIKCRDVRLIWGNHDLRPDILKHCKFTETHEAVILFEFDDDPGKLFTEKEVFEDSEKVKWLSDKKKYKRTRKIFLSHYCSLTYPLKVNSWHLYGHSHGELPISVHQAVPSLDVGVDAVHLYGSDILAPMAWKEIGSIMSDRSRKMSEQHLGFDIASIACGVDYTKSK